MSAEYDHPAFNFQTTLHGMKINLVYVKYPDVIRFLDGAQAVYKIGAHEFIKEIAYDRNQGRGQVTLFGYEIFLELLKSAHKILNDIGDFVWVKEIPITNKHGQLTGTSDNKGKIYDIRDLAGMDFRNIGNISEQPSFGATTDRADKTDVCFGDFR